MRHRCVLLDESYRRSDAVRLRHLLCHALRLLLLLVQLRGDVGEQHVRVPEVVILMHLKQGQAALSDLSSACLLKPKYVDIGPTYSSKCQK